AATAQTAVMPTAVRCLRASADRRILGSTFQRLGPYRAVIAYDRLYRSRFVTLAQREPLVVPGFSAQVCECATDRTEPVLPSSALGEVTPIASFTDLGLSSAQLQVLHRRGITEPLPIQAAIIPDALAGRDVSGMAPTGSGKTLAFALPMAALVARGLPRRPRGLVLAPTRELASQIAAELA